MTIANGTTGYGVGDLNRDGIVNNDDRAIINADLGAAIASGLLSTTDNIIGYCGYIFNAESPGAANGYLYTVRHRHYEPGLGRWLERDPLGYVDGMGLYEYVRSQPTFKSDARGLSALRQSALPPPEYEDWDPFEFPFGPPEFPTSPAPQGPPEPGEDDDSSGGPALGSGNCTLSKCHRGADLPIGRHGYLLLCCKEPGKKEKCESCAVRFKSGMKPNEKEKKKPWFNPRDLGPDSPDALKHKCATVAEDNGGTSNPAIDTIWNCCTA